MKRARSTMMVLGVLAGAALGCNAIFGIGDYRVGDSDAAAEGGEAAPMCGAYDAASGQCYPCPPKIEPEFLNACTGAQCVPFDDTTRVLGVLADGGLPPVPDRPVDGGAG